ncbi:MAG: FISUMP domain-containing protein [Bacteroidota bacterium]
MRTIAFTILFIGSCLTIQAQNYLIDFSGTGVSNSVDSVKIENLSQCTSLTIAGSDVLNLNPLVGMDESGNRQDFGISVFPNPSSGHCSLVFDATSDNDVSFGLLDMNGKTVLQQKEFLSSGHHTFQLSGIPGGVYGLTIESGKCRYSVKLISNAALQGNPIIKKTESTMSINNLQAGSGNGETRKMSASKSIIGMQFNAGDTLKLTGKSGNCRTISMLFPTHNQTVTFNFVKCADADSNYYAVVQIGNQVWMQENLKATHYRDGSPIPNVPDSATWTNLSSGAYCNYHNDTAEGTYYGRLYNWYVIADSRNICPVGWHVASNPEWNIMEKFLDPTVDTSAWMGRGQKIGRILKEGCTTRWAYLDTTRGWNCAGFTALCTNFRNNTGAWSLAPNNDHDDAFWTSSSYSATTAWGLSLRWCFGDIYAIPLLNKKTGQSIRCIKD